MPDESVAVFLSYRRDEARHIAGRLADRLAEKLGPSSVFMDVDNIGPGADFVAAIEQAVSSCNVLIVLIGPTWVAATDTQGRRKLEDPDDFVVQEIRAALERDILVIPVLVDGASVPYRLDLPESIRQFARRNAVRLDHETFRSDVTAIVDAIVRELERQKRRTGVETKSPRVIGAGRMRVSVDEDAWKKLIEAQRSKRERR